MLRLLVTVLVLLCAAARAGATERPLWLREPALSPDGRRLAYAAERDGRWGLYEVVPAQGTSAASPRPPA